MLIENLSKEIETKAMSAVRGGVANSASEPTALAEVNNFSNIKIGNQGPGAINQIDVVQEGSVSQSQPYTANWGIMGGFGFLPYASLV